MKNTYTLQIGNRLLKTNYTYDEAVKLFNEFSMKYNFVVMSCTQTRQIVMSATK